MMKFIRILIYCLFVFGVNINAQEYLTGELYGDYNAGEYIVSGNIYVLPGKRLNFAPGTVLKFEPFTGIIVRGSLLCRGDSENGILLTSVKENNHEMPDAEPAAFDWNGLKLEPNAELLDFKHVKLQYSTFGIKIEGDSTIVNIEKCLFTDNGYAHLMKGEEYVNITPGKKIDYTLNYKEKEQQIKTELSEKENIKKKEKESSWKFPVRIGSAAVALGGGAAWIIGYSAWKHYDSQYSLAVSEDEQDRFDKKRNSSKAASVIGGVFCVLGAAGFTVTFFF